MKRCPECRRDYYDETLLYCLDDGSSLLDGPASGGAKTAVLDRVSEHRSVEGETKLYEGGPETVDLPQPLTGSGSDARRRRRWVPLLVAGSAVLALGVVGVFLYRSLRPNRPTISMASAKITRLTTNGKALEAAISPDGKWVVYVQKDGAKRSLWICQVATNSAIPIVPTADVRIGRETFSRDGNYIFYYITDADNPSGALYQAPTIGGAPRKILSNIASPVTFSPNGSRIAFIRNDEAATGEDQLIVANADGTDERKLVGRKGDKWFHFPGGCDWSPDGTVIACPAGEYKDGMHNFVIGVDAETGEQKEFSSVSFLGTGRVAWLVDGSALVTNATERGANFDQLWQITYPEGIAYRISNDLVGYSGVSFTADTKSFVTVQEDQTSNVWVGAAADSGHLRQITEGKYEGGINAYGGLSWTPEGRIAYVSLTSGNSDVWIMNADGSGKKQLTTSPANDHHPAVSPDGRYIVFVSDRVGLPSIWRMDIDGGNVKQLTDQEDSMAQFSPDGKWVVYDSWRTGRRTMWRISVDGGEPIQISDKFSSSSSTSPDGKLIASFYKEERPNSPWRIMILPFGGGQPLQTFDAPGADEVTLEARLAWSPDARAVTYVDDAGEAPNLWSQPITGGPPKQITDFKENGIWWYALSRDGKQIALTRGTRTSDAVLISNFQ